MKKTNIRINNKFLIKQNDQYFLSNVSDYDKYYSHENITVTCSDGYSGTPIVTCSGESFVLEGCIEGLKCIGNKNETWRTSTGEVITRIEFSNDLGELTGFNPTNDGKFPCPLPSINRTEEDLIWPDGSDEEKIQKCCERVGLCSGNDNSIEDFQCPDGKQVKKGSDGIDILGTNENTCCEIVTPFNINLVLNGNYDSVVGSEDSLVDSFKEKLKQDIVEIINENKTTISNITENHIDIISVKKGSIKVSFTVRPDENGYLITKKEIKDIFTIGKTFQSTGITLKSVDAKKPEVILFTLPNPFGEEGIGISKGIIISITFISVLLTLLLIFGKQFFD